MPTLVRFYVKSAFVWLVIALFLKAIIILPRGASLPAITPVSWHLLFMGWLTQLIFGIGHWMLPTAVGASREHLRGSETLMWGVWAALNMGLLLRLIAEPMQTAAANPLWAILLVVSALLQWLAGIGFVINSWRRVRAPVRRGKRG